MKSVFHGRGEKKILSENEIADTARALALQHANAVRRRRAQSTFATYDEMKNAVRSRAEEKPTIIEGWADFININQKEVIVDGK